MFKGTAEIKLDAKGRFALPKRMRQTVTENFASSLVVTVNPLLRDKCLLLFPLTYWREIEEKVRAIPNSDPGVRLYQRLLIGHAEEISPDGAGRLLLSQPLRQHAELEHTLMMIGQGQKWELWAKKLWQQYLDAESSAAPTPDSAALQIAL
ncbi:MAG: division/cell wall cluster transcriptional repressor MraZ [Gammaproteobacteria bacterium]|nr:division/cell wall cluster transcriptional repressor MraZ [Pseudomonadota bacterium]MCH9663316.1 division/cell wall cluster transcriptional repressor MraZ [Gammaproteobacteria bacterium]